MKTLTTTLKKKQTVIISGAGPAGLLLAHHLLLSERYQIVIYERGPENYIHCNKRAFPLSLQIRGRNALNEIPQLLEQVSAAGCLIDKTLHYHPGKKPSQSKTQLPRLLISRFQLVKALLASLKTRPNQQNLTIHFDTQCTQVNLTNNKLSIKHQDGSEQTVNFDYLVAADGARSAIRQSLEKQQLISAKLEYSTMNYKMLTIPSSNSQTPLSSQHTHLWGESKGAGLMLLPKHGGGFLGMVMFSKNKNPFRSLPTGFDVIDYFQQHYPEITPLLPRINGEALLTQPAANYLSVRTDQLHIKNKVLLLGDAAHAISPALGQGCNLALQDAQVFFKSLERCGHQWQQALPLFTREHLPNILAIQELTKHSFPSSARLRWEFVFRMSLGQKLGRWGKLVNGTLPTSLINNTDLSFKEVLNQTQGWVNKVKHDKTASKKSS